MDVMRPLYEDSYQSTAKSPFDFGNVIHASNFEPLVRFKN